MKSVTFLGKHFEISSDIKRFFEICDWFGTLDGPLKDVFIKKMEVAAKDPKDVETMVWPLEEDFQIIKNPMLEAANKVVLELSQYGYYDITATDLVEKNPGYIHMHEESVSIQKKYFKTVYNALSDYTEGMDEAYQSAASNITGSGVGIITNSALDAGLYWLRENGIIMQQARQADAEYSASMKKLGEAFYDDIQKNFAVILKSYYPKCFADIDEFIENMLKVFLDCLQRVGKLESKVLLAYDSSRSEALLSNIDKIGDKQALLQSAFKQCPYDPAIYWSTIFYGYGTSSLFELMRELNITSTVINKVIEKCEDSQSDINVVSNAISFMRQNKMFNEDDCKAIAQKANSGILKNISDLSGFALNGGGNFKWQKQWISDNNIAASSDQLLDELSEEDLKERIKDAIDAVYSDENLSRLQVYYTGSPERNNQKEMTQRKEKLAEQILGHISECMDQLREIRNELSREKNTKEGIDSRIDDLRRELSGLSVFKISLKKKLSQEIEEQEIKEVESLQRRTELEKQYTLG